MTSHLPAPPNVERRRALGLLAGAGAGLVALAGCAKEGGDDATTSSTTGSATGSSPSSASPTSSGGSGSTAGGSGGTDAVTVRAVVPEETAGPYPADGSNGPDVLTTDGVVRSDLTRSFDGSTGSVDGVAFTLELTLVDVAAGGGRRAGAAVYAWHCDADGRYSLYSEGVTDQNWLRGVQVAGEDGTVRFTSVFPGCYPGRWPHIHFEVYASLDDATGGGPKLVTSQVALPEDACQVAYGAEGYDSSTANLSRLSIDQDLVFRDGVSLQLATVTGSVDDGFVARLNVGV